MSTTKSVGTLFAKDIRVDNTIETSSITSGSLTVNGSQTITGGLTVEGTTITNGSSSVAGEMSIGGSSYVSGNLFVDGVIVGNISGGTVSGGTVSGFTPYDDLSVGTLEISDRIVFSGLNDNAPIRIGKDSGINVGPSNESIAIGNDTGINSGKGSIAIGEGASNANAGEYSIAIGYDAGQNGLADNSIAIGRNASTGSQTESSIVINATGSDLDPSGGLSGLFIKPIRQENTSGLPPGALWYDNSSGEIRSQIDDLTSGGSGFTPYDDLSVGTLEIRDRIITNINGQINIGEDTGISDQGGNSIAIGTRAGKQSQAATTIAIGLDAGSSGQGDVSIAIGSQAGKTNQGDESIAIGINAGKTNQPNNSIIINSDPTFPNGNLQTSTKAFYITPIRNISGDDSESDFVPLFYNATTGEVGYKS
jgi:hypothetical protein